MKGLTALVAVVVLAAAPAARADTSVPAGFDLFETDPEETVFTFQDETAIPAGFFDQGSEKFEGSVNFGGEPIMRFMGKNVGDTDTVVQHPAFTVPDGGDTTVDIELQVLHIAAMAPISVVVNGQPQEWDVQAEVSPSRPSPGLLRVADTSEGGRLDSQLRVYPKFTFTRLSDGATKVLDVGALPDGQRPEIALEAGGVPWRAGCLFPALAVAGLNEGFCVSETERGQKLLTVEKARLANHGIRPVQPRLEHFQCYSLAKHSKFKSRSAELQDQFGRHDEKIGSPTRFCNPVRKAKEPLDNKLDHLYCYAMRGHGVGKPVRLRNQFGPFAGLVQTAQRLCLSTRKRLPGKKAPPKSPFQVDHFECYGLKATGKYKRRSVLLRDQFTKGKMRVFKPSLLCAPVSKEGVGLRHWVRHLVCYVRTDKAPKVTRKLLALNEYGKKQKAVTAKPLELCVPTDKLLG